MSADEADYAPRADGSGEDAIKSPLVILLGELIRLILQHVALARAELAESGTAFGIALVLTIAALVTGFTAIILLLVAVALACAVFIPIWLAFLLVGAGALLGSAGLWLLARAYARRSTLMPRRAMASLHRHFNEIGGQLR